MPKKDTRQGAKRWLRKLAKISRISSIALVLVVSSVTASAQDDVQTRMRLWSDALGVPCTHCHFPDAWTDPSKPSHEFAQRMHHMLDALNAGPLRDVDPITCWTCHRGQTRPPRLPRPLWEGIQSAHAGDFAAKPDRAFAMSVYSASLGVD